MFNCDGKINVYTFMHRGEQRNMRRKKYLCAFKKNKSCGSSGGAAGE